MYNHVKDRIADLCVIYDSCVNLIYFVKNNALFTMKNNIPQ